jgi:methylated-DNA-[protein]-cysteine S-methyltransferase
MKTQSKYQAKILAPFGVLGICCEKDRLTRIDFLPLSSKLLVPESPFVQEVSAQLAAYFKNPDYEFKLPLRLNGTDHQSRVWQSMCAIPRGKTKQYGEIAKELASSARAVGQACGSNPVPIVIPCHRIVSKLGIGGFAHHKEGYELSIKRWLLNHESSQNKMSE